MRNFTLLLIAVFFCSLNFGQTTNYIPKYTSSSTFGNSILFQSPSGGIGIGGDPFNGKFTIYQNGSLTDAAGSTIPLMIWSGSETGALRLSVGVDKNNNCAYLQPARAWQDYKANLVLNYLGGNVGIGVSTPKTKFQIGDIWTFHDGANDKIIGRNTYNNGSNNIRIQAAVASRMLFNNTGDIVFQTAPTGTAGSTIADSQWQTVTIKNNGSVGIGTTNTTHLTNFKLAVKGRILCEGVEVITTVPQADYVFESDYKLSPLSEVENFIKENKHLPNIPSAKEFQENGYNIVDMDEMLLRKVEEHTLYLIQMQKLIEELMLENKDLKLQIEKMQNGNK